MRQQLKSALRELTGLVHTGEVQERQGTLADGAQMGGRLGASGTQAGTGNQRPVAAGRQQSSP